MDAIDTLQSSAPETKAERIARYKAERRRELAERYGNTDEITSKYVRRDRKVGDTSETPSSDTKEKEKYEDNTSERSYTRRGPTSRAAAAEHTECEPTKGIEDISYLKENTETVSSSKISSQFRWVFSPLHKDFSDSFLGIPAETEIITIPLSMLPT